MNCTTVDPNDLHIDEQNERKSTAATSDLEQSIMQAGIVQPPVVRENGDGYTVVIGQRRTLAARAVGLDEITVNVAEWDDYEAIKSSITENYDVFRNEVDPKDRAKALLEMARLSDDPDAFQDDEKKVPSPQWLADELGDAKPKTISTWIERLRPQWEGTPFGLEHVSEDSEETPRKEKSDKIGDRKLTEIRRATTIKNDDGEVVEEGGGEAGTELATKIVTGKKGDDRFSEDDVHEVRRQTDRGTSVDEAIENIEESRSGRDPKTYSVRCGGELADGVFAYARDHDTSEVQAIRDILTTTLEQEGYL